MLDQDKQKFLIAFGNRIRKLRTDKHLSLDELARKCGYTSENARSSIQKIEAGKTDIPSSKIILLAQALEVPIGKIMGWDDEQQLPEKVLVMKKFTTADRLKQIMAERGMKQVDILEACKPYCEKYGVPLKKNDLSQYISGRVNPKQNKLSILGMALNVNEAWLMGYNVPAGRDELDKWEQRLQNNGVKQCEIESAIEKHYGKEGAQILQLFDQLNKQGKAKAIDTLSDLTAIEKYTKSETIHTIKKAARNGNFEEKTITDSELDAIKNLPDVDDLK